MTAGDFAGQEVNAVSGVRWAGCGAVTGILGTKKRG